MTNLKFCENRLIQNVKAKKNRALFVIFYFKKCLYTYFSFQLKKNLNAYLSFQLFWEIIWINHYWFQVDCYKLFQQCNENNKPIKIFLGFNLNFNFSVIFFLIFFWGWDLKHSLKLMREKFTICISRINKDKYLNNKLWIHAKHDRIRLINLL